VLEARERPDQQRAAVPVAEVSGERAAGMAQAQQPRLKSPKIKSAVPESKEVVPVNKIMWVLLSGVMAGR